MLGLKFTHVSKSGPRWSRSRVVLVSCQRNITWFCNIFITHSSVLFIDWFLMYCVIPISYIEIHFWQWEHNGLMHFWIATLFQVLHSIRSYINGNYICKNYWNLTQWIINALWLFSYPALLTKICHIHCCLLKYIANEAVNLDNASKYPFTLCYHRTNVYLACSTTELCCH